MRKNNSNSSQKSSNSRGYTWKSPMPARHMMLSSPAAPTHQQQHPPIHKDMALSRPPPPPPPPPSRSATTKPDKVVVVQHQQPGMARTFGATAAGVAVGSAVGHTVGQAITGGGGGKTEEQSRQVDQMTEASGPCGREIKKFLQCAQNESDLTLCEEFNEAVKQCKIYYNIK